VDEQAQQTRCLAAATGPADKVLGSCHRLSRQGAWQLPQAQQATAPSAGSAGSRRPSRLSRQPNPQLAQQAQLATTPSAGSAGSVGSRRLSSQGAWHLLVALVLWWLLHDRHQRTFVHMVPQPRPRAHGAHGAPAACTWCPSRMHMVHMVPQAACTWCPSRVHMVPQPRAHGAPAACTWCPSRGRVPVGHSGHSLCPRQLFCLRGRF